MEDPANMTRQLRARLRDCVDDSNKQWKLLDFIILHYLPSRRRQVQSIPEKQHDLRLSTSQVQTAQQSKMEQRGGGGMYFLIQWRGKCSPTTKAHQPEN